jgi:uncharacterized protein YndB with AHSA1/START domain
VREQSKTISIARPVDMVFAFLADAENDKLWRKSVVEVTRTGDVGVGARYHQTLASRGDRRSDALVETTEFVPDTRIAFTTTTGPLRRIGSYDLRAVDNGTEVTFRLSAELLGLQKLMTPLVALAMEAQVGAVSELKRVLESRTEL